MVIKPPWSATALLAGSQQQACFSSMVLCQDAPHTMPLYGPNVGGLTQLRNLLKRYATPSGDLELLQHVH